ncbi:MAG: hypothetical protein PT944_03280 [Actinomycetaceae bacterium]|nr:hypothetical protein [Actinomycetaceae bacterium]
MWASCGSHVEAIVGSSKPPREQNRGEMTPIAAPSPLCAFYSLMRQYGLYADTASAAATVLTGAANSLSVSI